MTLECPGVLKIAEASGAHTERIEHGGTCPARWKGHQIIRKERRMVLLDGSVSISDSD
jgi:hypothetical protein